MGERKQYALRIDGDLLKAVERWAADEFRSTNGQLETIIVQALRKAGRMPSPPEPGDAEEPSSQS